VLAVPVCAVIRIADNLEQLVIEALSAGQSQQAQQIALLNCIVWLRIHATKDCQQVAAPLCRHWNRQSPANLLDAAQDTNDAANKHWP